MRNALLATILIWAVGIANAETLKYEPAVVRLVGTLVSGSGETPDEVKVKFPAIKLKAPVRVEAAQKDEINETEDNVSLVQLILTSKQMKQFEALKSQKVVITGKLTHAITGHHYTKVLIDVQEIENR